MKTLVIVSKCTGTNKGLLKFKFKGVCMGESIKSVELTDSRKGKGLAAIKKGSEYLLYVSGASVKAGILKAEIIKAKKLEECVES